MKVQLLALLGLMTVVAVSGYNLSRSQICDCQLDFDSGSECENECCLPECADENNVDEDECDDDDECMDCLINCDRRACGGGQDCDDDDDDDDSCDFFDDVRECSSIDDDCDECEECCEEACDGARPGCGGPSESRCRQRCKSRRCGDACSSDGDDDDNDRCEQVSSRTVENCNSEDDEDDCEKCCRNECEDKNDCRDYKCRNRRDCDDFDYCYDDCVADADCSSLSSSDDRCEQVSSRTVENCNSEDDEDDCEKCCRNECEDKNDCRDYKCRNRRDCDDFDYCYDDCVADADCSSLSSSSSSCDDKIDRCCNCVENRCSATSDTSVSADEKSCIEDDCKNRCKDAGRCEYNRSNKWKKVIRDDCDVPY